VRVVGLAHVVAIAGGRDHSLAVKSNGSVWAWGWNRYGQLGDGTTTNRSSPVRVLLPTTLTIRRVTAGADHSVALSKAGRVWAWGQNSFGQLGDGTGVERHRPVRLTSIAGIVAVGTGRLHTLAVGSGGGVWAWGDNDFGQLGDGTKTTRRAPVRVAHITTGEQVAGGRDYSVALVG
jgi:alpha-tubulin suppressor-like RCC1 family protein